ncbi:MAG: thiamine-phosphate kinase [Alphaproteobacteria bacterium]|nr:thiamine-phosphate kinase [Alphaproteobacteria bacterium]
MVRPTDSVSDAAASPGPVSFGEFERIDRIFAPLSAGAPGAFGLTDDAALLPELPPGQAWTVTVDALVAGVHFLADDPPDLIARKALRCNLSDLAAMGAVPAGYTLALALPRGMEDAVPWIEQFAIGLGQDQAEFGIHLFGGDSVSTDGPIWASITAFGTVSGDRPLRRSGARPGDDIWVSGTLGDAALGLLVLRGQILRDDVTESLVGRYHLPHPRVSLGPALVGTAHAALDISDGLVQDAGHIARRSGVAIEIEAPSLPLSQAMIACIDSDPDLLHHVLVGGDDYELLFTAAPEARTAIEEIAARLGVRLTRIGTARDETAGVKVLDRHGETLGGLERGGWTHA